MFAYVPHRRRGLPLTTWWIAITAATSIVAAIEGGGLALRLALVPRLVWRGELWRLVTWPFVIPGALGLVFTCIAIYFFGSPLLSVWGARKLRRFILGTILIGGVGTCLVAPVVPIAWWYPHLGGMALTDALVIAWALQFPDARLRIYGLVEVGGPTLAYGTVMVTGLLVLFSSLAPFLPELLACGFALTVMTGAHRRWWARLRTRRGGSLGVHRGGRHGGPFGPDSE